MSSSRLHGQRRGAEYRLFQLWIGSNRLEGQVVMEDGVVTISRISRTGSGHGFEDGLPTLWLNKLPSFLRVSCPENPNAALRVEEGVLRLYTNGVDGEYTICVTI